MRNGPLRPLEYSVIQGVRHWPAGDGNYWAGFNTFTDRENLLADWLDQVKRERDGWRDELEDGR